MIWELSKAFIQTHICSVKIESRLWAVSSLKWRRDVHAFSQPLVITGTPDEIVVSTPMRFANIIRLNDAEEREVVSMRWGFAAKGDKTPSRPKHMHARSETIDKLPTFANAFVHGRGILVVHTFNEGEELPSGKTKQWVITPNDAKPIAIAVICEKWTNGAETLDVHSSNDASQRTDFENHR